MQTFLAKVALIFATFSVGAFLRTTGAFNKQDAKAAELALTYGTFPSLVLQTLLTYGFIGWEGAAIALAAVFLNLLLATSAWYAFSKRRKAERALLTASTVGIALGSVAYAFVEAAFSPSGLHFAVLWDLGNMLAACVLSYFVLARGGNPLPEQYVHADGGKYRGQWRGAKKHGLGVYTYPGGGRYEGRWADNLKEGLGVYTYPKGGWYEGEWRKGERCGVGLRVFRSGAVQAGRWEGTMNAARLEPAECAFTATSARQVGDAATRVPVGGGSPQDVALQLLKQPALWAAAAAAASIATSYHIPVALDLLTAHLATAHVPLALLVFGLHTEWHLPSSRQVGDVANSLALRIFLPVAAAAVAALALSSRYTEVIAVAAICTMGPLSEQMPHCVQLFRLNEALFGSLLSAARIASFLTLAVLAFCLVLATPADSLLSRSGLAVGLACALAVVTVCGSLAVWWLSARAAAPQAASRSSGAPASGGKGLEASAARAVENPQDIPAGIAWRESRTDAPELEQGAVRSGAVDDALELGVGPPEGISSACPEESASGIEREACADKDNVPGGAQKQSAVDAGTPSMEVGEAGGLGTDLDETETALPSTTQEMGSDGPSASRSRNQSSASRRRSGGRPFQDVNDESGSVGGWGVQEGFGEHPVTPSPAVPPPAHRRPRRGFPCNAARATHSHTGRRLQSRPHLSGRFNWQRWP